MRKNSLAFRIGIACAALSVLTITLVGAAVIMIFTVSSQRILDNHLMAYTDVIVSAIQIEDGVVFLEDAARLTRLPRYWQISENGKPLFRSSNLVDAMPVEPDNLNEPQRMDWRTAAGQHISAVQSTFLFPQGRHITLVSGLDRDVADAYRTQERDELVKPLLRVMAAGAGLLIAANILLLYLALRPLARIRAALQDVREGRAARITGDYPGDIADLANDINRLMDFHAGALVRHREYAANLAHSLKTPLTVIANETDMAVVREKLRSVGEIIDRSLARAHASGNANILGVRTPVLPVLQDIADGFGKLHGKQVTIDFAPDIIFAGDRADLFEIAGSIIENACKFSRTRVAVTGGIEAIIVEDDGPGIAVSMREHVLARGARLDESTGGTGIGLAVARDVTALYDGALLFETSPLGGLKVLIKLPLSC